MQTTLRASLPPILTNWKALLARGCFLPESGFHEDGRTPFFEGTSQRLAFLSVRERCLARRNH